MKMNCNKISVIFSSWVWTSGDEKGVNHAEIEGAGKTLCGKSTLTWEGTGLSLKNVNCIVCRKRLKKLGCLK